MRRRSARVAAGVHTNRSRPVSSRGVRMPCRCRLDAVPMPFLAGSTLAERPHTRLRQRARLRRKRLPGASTRSSGRHADHPGAETHLDIHPRPAQVAGVPAAGVPNLDAAGAVADPDEPGALAKPACAINQAVAPGPVRPRARQRKPAVPNSLRRSFWNAPSRTVGGQAHQACVGAGLLRSAGGHPVRESPAPPGGAERGDR